MKLIISLRIEGGVLLKKVFFWMFVCVSTPLIFAQTAEISGIKSNPDFIWGEGKSSSYRKADQEALAMISEQISVSVESQFELLKQKEKGETGTTQSKELINSVVRTHSKSTIKHTESIKLELDGQQYVFRYLAKSEVKEIFDDRKVKINDFIKLAQRAEASDQVAEALQYYYWALSLLISLPDGNTDRIVVNFEEINTSIYLRSSMDRILSNLSFHLVEDSDPDYIGLSVTHKGSMARSCDFQFNYGDVWSETLCVKDGRIAIERLGRKIDPKLLRFRVECAFENQWHIDDDIMTVMEQLPPLSIDKRMMGLSMQKQQQSARCEATENQSESAISGETNDKSSQAISVQQAFAVDNPTEYRSVIHQIESAFRTNSQLQCRSHFTDEGWAMFQALVNNGTAKVVASPDLKFIGLGDQVIARSLPMQFKFKRDGKTIAQNVVFSMNKEGKVESLAFALSQGVVQEIMARDKWDEAARLTIIHFLETYQTAYALKRSDYLDAIFDDNALIIVGSVVKKANVDPENQFGKNSPIVKTTQYSKSEYITNLKKTFNANEYINLRFTESNIQESNKYKNVFGIRVRQDYYSTNYGDSGYLFLLVDLRQPEKPIIHVRVWQEEKDPKFGWADLDLFL